MQHTHLDPSSAEMGTIADARARFGIPRSTLYKWTAAGHVRMVKPVGSRLTLVDLASLRAFLATAPAVVLRGAAPQGQDTAA